MTSSARGAGPEQPGRRGWSRLMRERARPERERAVAFEPHELTGLFAAPRWLRDLGTTAWLGVGVTLMTAGLVWLLALTHAIVTPVITAAIVAAVASPLVGWLERRRVPRGLASALVLLGLIALGVGLTLAILTGVTSQLDELGRQLADAKRTIGGWLTDLGVSEPAAAGATHDASQALDGAVPALLQGLAGGLAALSSLAVFLALTALSLFFLLKDGPLIRGWAERR